jgi:PKD repeat protein
MHMSDGKDKGSFWTSIPGILTGLTALISALAGIYLGITPVIHTFVANPTSIMMNDSAELSWHVTNAQSVFIDGGVGFKGNNDSCMVSPKETTSYNITAKNFWLSRNSTATIEVRPEEPPEVLLEAIVSYYPPNPKVGQTIEFDGSKSKGQKYFWDFGDGIEKSGEEVSHKYTKGGTYLVNLTVTSDQGVNSSSIELEVIEPLEAIFSYCSVTKVLNFRIT